MATLLWEDNFYENGVAIADRIVENARAVPIADAHRIAIKARTEGNLRHVPLLIAAGIASQPGNGLSRLLPEIIQRADELTEFLAIYWKDRRQPLSAQIKKGLARAFGKFNEYQLAKYDRDGAVRLRDVLFLSHAKPDSEKQADMWKRLIDGNLKTPDTWETRLSSGADKRVSFSELMAEGKLGGMAFIRNLRNMEESGVDRKAIIDYFAKANFSRLNPYRFLAALKHAPSYASQLEQGMFQSCASMRRLPGTTAIIVDNSGSMYASLSAKSEMDRIDAAISIAMIAREISDDARVYAFAQTFKEVAPLRGFGLFDRVKNADVGWQTRPNEAVEAAKRAGADRIIVITDEQIAGRGLASPGSAKGYVINTASHRNGVGYGAWNHIDGFSDATLKWIAEFESF